MADFNLALGKAGGIGGLKSPFYNYIMNNSGSGGFYQSAGQSDEDAIARLTFVTDGLFPQDSRDYDDDGTGAGGEIYDLNDGRHQPFQMRDLATKGGRKPNFSTFLMGQSMNDRQRWIEHLGRVGCAALFDYLDTDHVPCSLALPVTERVPMICGASVNFPGSKFLLKKEVPEPPNYTVVEGTPSLEPTSATDSQTVEVTVKYKIDAQQFTAGFMGGNVQALALYPFSRPDEALDGNFNIDGRFAMFFSTDEMNFRTGNPSDALQISSKQIASAGDSKEFTDNGLFVARFQPVSFGAVNNVKMQQDAIKKFDNISLKDGGVNHATRLNMEGNEFLRVTYQWRRSSVPLSDGAIMQKFKWDNTTLAEAVNAGVIKDGYPKTESAFKMLNKGGVASQDFLNGIKQDRGPTVRLNAAVWLRVTDGNDTVDMVPASIFDDKVQNNIPDVQTIYQGLSGRLGLSGPLLKFGTGVEFEMSIAKLDELANAGQDIAITPKAILCPDPRFNHAPESWMRTDDALSAESWLGKTNLGKGDRDRDFFLATSDAGYLQSKWEIAHLQRFGNLETYGGDETIGNMAAPPASQNDYANAFDNVLNHAVMWRTYDPFAIDEEAFANLPWKSEGSGQKVNPYSDSENVLMAAFANTPVDWRRASTNNLAGTDYAAMSSAQFNKDYAFNEYANDADRGKIRWQTLQGVAARFKVLVREKAADGDKGGIAHWKDKRQNLKPQYTPWEEAWQEMDWLGPDDGTELCTVQMQSEATLYDCDRKFLYGYWRDCFAPKQQLYLVFVRAEPAMMGGDVSGQVPPQLGARAMAVVWRDPYRTKQDGDVYRPHRTRILFYRQFE